MTARPLRLLLGHTTPVAGADRACVLSRFASQCAEHDSHVDDDGLWLTVTRRE